VSSRLLSDSLVIVLSMADRVFGHISGNPPGTTYINREALSRARVHGPNQAGIWGGEDGAESIVVSGGYVDDQDYSATTNASG
jgi:putative restriction endonuclease